jgi:sugar lactone lactonase YvrE
MSRYATLRLLLVFLFSVTVISFSARCQTIRTIAGNSQFGNRFSGDGLPAVEDSLGGIYGVYADTLGNVYFTDQYYNVLRKIDANGIMHTIAGNWFPGGTGNGGAASAARLQSPQGITMDAAGNIYVADAGNKVVRKITPSGNISIYAGGGTGAYGSGDGDSATHAVLGAVCGLAFDNAGNLYIADFNTKLRKVNISGIITTVVGTAGTIGYSGDGGPATAAAASNISDVTTDASGNVYISDYGFNAIRKINTAGIISLVAGSATTLGGSTGDGGPATSARLNGPTGVRIDATGNMFISDQSNSRIRKVTSGIISTYAGAVNGYAGDGGAPSACKMSFPSNICFDRRGNMYIADRGAGSPGTPNRGRRIRQIFKKDTFHISVSPGTVLCGNSYAAFTAHIHGAYYSHIIQWRRNGTIVGGNSPAWSSPSINNNDTITCAVVDTANGGMLLATSDTIVMTVLPPILPEVHVTSTGDTVCNGLPITFTATAVNGGTSPVFRWYVFSTLVWTGPVFVYTPAPGDIITCQLTSSDPCAGPNTAQVTFPLTVIPSFNPVVLVTASDTVIDYWGQLVTLFTNVTYGGTNPTYQWCNSAGPIPGATSASYFQEVYAADVFYCVMHSNAFCAVPETDTSNIVHIGTGTLGVSGSGSAGARMAVFPNPVDKQLNISLPGNGLPYTELKLQVADALGRTVLETTMPANSAHQWTVPGIDQLEPGIYTLIVSGGGTRFISRVTKM